MRPTGPKLDKDGFPIPQGFDEAGVADLASDSGATMRRIRRVLRLALVAALVTVVWTHYQLGAKISDRVGLYFGQEALNLYRRNDLPRALVAADRAVRWSPRNEELLLLRCQLKYLDKDYRGALADAELVLAQEPLEMQAHRLRRMALHFLKRHRDEAAAATELLEKQLGDRDTLLNDRAYARAQGEFDLDEALKDINNVLKSHPENPAFIDTRGYVLFKLGKYDEALKDLQKAVDITEAQLSGDALGLGFRRDRQLQALEESLGEMLYHRGEVYEKLGEKSKAQADFRAAERLGFSPNEGA